MGGFENLLADTAFFAFCLNLGFCYFLACSKMVTSRRIALILFLVALLFGTSYLFCLFFLTISARDFFDILVLLATIVFAPAFVTLSTWFSRFRSKSATFLNDVLFFASYWISGVFLTIIVFFVVYYGPAPSRSRSSLELISKRNYFNGQIMELEKSEATKKEWARLRFQSETRKPQNGYVSCSRKVNSEHGDVSIGILKWGVRLEGRTLTNWSDSFQMSIMIEKSKVKVGVGEVRPLVSTDEGIFESQLIMLSRIWPNQTKLSNTRVACWISR